MPRARSRPCEPAGSPFPFPHFPTARSYFFLYPAVLPAIPRATFPASFCPAGRQGQRRVLCRLPGWRSSALPFRPIGGAPGTAPLFLHPAARGTDAAQGRRDDASRWARPRRLSAGFCKVAEAMLPVGLVRGGLPPRVFPMPPRRCFPLGSSEAAFCGVLKRRRCAQCRRSLLSFSPRRPAVLLSLPSRPASDTARHFSCILLSRWAAGTAPRSLPPARVAEQRAPFSPYRRRARHCTSFSAPRRPPPDAAHGRPIHPDRQDNPSSLSMLPGDGRAHANRRAVPSISTLFRAHPALPGGGHARLIPPAPARGCSCSRLLPPHLSFDFRPALPSAQPTPVRASLPRRFLRFRAALFPAAARCIRPCSCAGGRVAPFFRLFPRAPRAFLALRPLCARPVRIASRRGKL